MPTSHLTWTELTEQKEESQVLNMQIYDREAGKLKTKVHQKLWDSYFLLF